MFNTWIVDAFRYFITQLMPVPVDSWGPGYARTILGLWTPDLGAFASSGAWNWLMLGMTGLGVAIGMWFAIPVVISASASGDARAVGQAGLGLAAAAAAGPTALALASAVRGPVLDTASTIMGVGTWTTLQTDGLFALVSTLIALLAYTLAGVIASYAFVFIVLLAPVAAAALVFRGGTDTFLKWLSWFLTLLFAPMFAAIALATAQFMASVVTTPVLSTLTNAVGILFAAFSPFLVLGLMSKITVGGGADGSTKVGAGTSAASSAQSAGQLVAMRGAR